MCPSRRATLRAKTARVVGKMEMERVEQDGYDDDDEEPAVTV
jgi:hypothetical protein